MKKPKVFITGFYRPEIELYVFKLSKVKRDHTEISQNKLKAILEILKKHNNEKVIIYTLTIKDAENLKLELSTYGHEFEIFHSKIKNKQKTETLNNITGRYGANKSTKLIATSAFGMGIDIKDIRVIIHYHMPSNIEDYYQQFGRAGRDNIRSFAYLLYEKSDENLNRFMSDISVFHNKYLNDEEKNKVREIEHNEINTMLNYIHSKRYWKYILDYFGQEDQLKNRRFLFKLLYISIVLIGITIYVYLLSLYLSSYTL